MAEFTCIRCRRTISDASGKGNCPVCRVSAIRRSLSYKICESNQCGHFVQCPKSTNWGCELHPRRPCLLDKHLIDGGGCFNDPPLFEPARLLGEPITHVEISFEPTPITPTAERAVVVFMIGDEAEQLADLSLPRIREYADKCGAQVVVVDDDQCPEWPIGNKLRFGEIACHFQRSLMLDLDLWAADHAPDVFATHEPGLWMHDDTPYVNQKGRDYLRGELDYLCRTFRCRQSGKLLNTGVVLMEREHAEAWKLPDRPLKISHTAEQAWIDVMLSSQFEVRTFTSEWNWLWFAKTFSQRIHEANFVHLAMAPHDQRLRILAELAG